MAKYALVIVVAVNCYLAYSVFWPGDNSFAGYLGSTIDTAEFESYLEERMADRGVPGLAIAVINEGEVVYQNTLGYADVQAQKPVTRNTIFEGASLSKPVFAFFVMTFVEQGELDLDRPLYEYYPHPDLALDEKHRNITARLALSHQSGLPNWRDDEPDQQLRQHFDPGTGYLYSGEGYQYLAMVLREIKNTDWTGLEAIFQDRVARPMNLDNTVYIQTPYTRQHKAEPYDSDSAWIDWRTDKWFLRGDGNFVAPASIHSEATDFSRWLQAVMRRDVLSTASYEQLLTPQSPVPSEAGELSMTLGFFKLHIPFTDLYFHTGNNVGFDAWFALDVEDDWGFVMFANSDNGEALGEELFFYLLAGPRFYVLPVILVLALITGVLLLAWGVMFAWRRYASGLRKPTRT